MANVDDNILIKWGDSHQEETIFGVNEDCIIMPTKHLNENMVVNNGLYEQPIYTPDMVTSLNPVEVDNQQPDVQDFVEIQVTEEEVISDNWNLDQSGVIVTDVKPRIDTGQSADEITIPLPQDQDLYSQMHPFPCDFCSKRFSKKSTLMNHMVSHKSSEDLHDCNLCGAKYRRKIDLVNHMKIHAYAPDRSIMEDDDDDFPQQYSQSPHTHKGRRKKSLVPKKNNSSSFSEPGTDLYDKIDKKPGKNRINKKGNKLSQSKPQNYVDEDMRLLSEMSRNVDIVDQERRWPVVDESRPYVCQHCGIGFAREKALASHSRIHAGDSPFECDVCGEMFWDVSLLREHSRSKHPHLMDSSPAGSVYTGDDRFGNFFCEICGISFHRLDLLKKHRRSHVKTEPTQENDDNICTVCGIYFENAIELLSHAETHRVENRCITCGQNFPHPSALSDHVRRFHNSESSNERTCTLCGKVCKDRRSLQKHTCMNSENRSFPCYSCNKRFHSRARLRRHMMSHRDKAVICSDCGDEFPDGRALLSHRHSHNTSSGSLPIRSFPCKDCGKTFGSRSSQQIHVRIHTGERPYGCRYCWKAFADGGTLRKHERIHTGEKPYVCPVCPKAFNQRVVLREHIRAHHSGTESKVNSCYECKVCGYLFNSSSELCLHLVQHSDENTAKHRQPSVGPRKYKRRRKMLQTHDIPDMMNSMHDDEDGDYESTDSSDSHVEKKKVINKRKFKHDSNQTKEGLNIVVQQCENALQNLNSMVIKSEPKEKKVKIDKTSKKHKTKTAGKLLKGGRNEKRAKAAKLLNNTSYASKYVVSRPDELKPNPNNEHVRPRTKNVTYQSVDEIDSINGTDGMRNRPRTKNVNFRNLTVTKLEPATFPVTKTRKKTKTRKSSGRKPKFLETKIVNGSNQFDSFDKSGLVSEENLETCIVPDFNIEGIKNEIPTIEETTIMPMDSCVVKSELISCEMCTELFSDRTQLLNHIRIHI